MRERKTPTRINIVPKSYPELVYKITLIEGKNSLQRSCFTLNPQKSDAVFVG